MKRIENNEALKILLRGGPKFIIDADSLNYLIKEEEPLECYEDSECIIFINMTKDTDYVTVVPMSNALHTETLVDLINEKCTNPSVLIDIQNLSEEHSADLDCALGAFLKYQQTLEDYIYLSESEQSPEYICDNIQILEPADKELFEAITAKPEKDRPPLHILFDIFVTKKQGYILGAFDNEKIIGYLSFTQILPDVFDLDYIYVEPEKRKLRIGKNLAEAYKKYARDNNHIAYWSNAKNAASKNTALSCGFHLIRQAKKYIKV